MEVPGSSAGIRRGEDVSEGPLIEADRCFLMDQASAAALREDLLRLRIENAGLKAARTELGSAVQAMQAALDASRASLANPVPEIARPSPKAESMLMRKAADFAAAFSERAGCPAVAGMLSRDSSGWRRRKAR